MAGVMAAEKFVSPAPQGTHLSRIGNINLGGIFGITQSKKGLIWLATTEGHLWVSTYGGGLNKFDPQTERFEKIDLRLAANDPPETDSLYFLSIDAANTLWIGSVAGLKRVDIKTRKALALPQALLQIPKNAVNGTFIDSKKHLWIGTYEDGAF